MSNLLNSALINQSAIPAQQVSQPTFTIDTEGKVKPLAYKGTLLPSKIFSSPKEYAHDLKQDILNIGKAAKGQANDYELGRINDVALKLGGLGLAAYLFVKNPLKLSKTMEFIGLGTFLGGMSLWPKLMIQAPLKLRTGVDIHQKYIDSQGRKKMLHQDPQYDLTDLYSREDLDKMGEKLKVNENLPDRDNFIKQRAKKTALQGNTLWMMSSFSTPIVSGLACKALEAPVGDLLETVDLATSAAKLKHGAGPIEKVKQFLAQKSLQSFLRRNADRLLNEREVSELADRIGSGANSADLINGIRQELSQLRNSVSLNNNIVENVFNGLKGVKPESIAKARQAMATPEVMSAIQSGSVDTVAEMLSLAAFDGMAGGRQAKLTKQIAGAINKTMEEQAVPRLGDVASRIQDLHSSILSFTSERSLLDRFLNARVVERDGTYIARQWNKVCTRLLKSLKLSDAELKEIASGNVDLLYKRLQSISSVGNEGKYQKVVEDLADFIRGYQYELNPVQGVREPFMDSVRTAAGNMCEKAAQNLNEKGFSTVAEKIKSSAGVGCVENTIISNAQERVLGAQSSFYRLLQALDIFKNENTIQSRLKIVLQDQGVDINNAEQMAGELIKKCKKIVMEAKTTDYIEKLGGKGFGLSENEYKAVMKVLFDEKEQIADSGIHAVLRNMDDALKGYSNYISEFNSKVVNYRNDMTPELARRTVGEATSSMNGSERANLIGSTVVDTIKDSAKKMYNTNKWLKIFGISLAVIAATTLIVGLTFGRKSKMEKQVEEESKKVNG